jgi:indole-3-glycerol phosphate synthase
MILDDILAHKRHEVATSMRRRSLDSVRSEAFRQPTPRPFGANLRATTGSPARLIAEIKRRSPSAGAMADVPDPVVLARTYQANGASAISTLTDGHFFGGSLDDLRAVSQAVTIPVLRKDFLFTEYQLWEARAAGADAALLIVAALASPLATPGNADELDHPLEDGDPDLDIARERLAHLLGVARGAGLEILVEVHDEAEAAVALSVNAAVIGINNRDLRTFITTLDATERVAMRLPRGTNGPVIVSESGLHDLAAVERVRAAGAHAILVGEALVRAPDIGAKVREMSGTVLVPGVTDAHGLHQSTSAALDNPA